MCGRYQFSADEYKEIRQIVRDAQRRSEGNELNFPMAGDICPSQVAPVLVSRGEKIVGEFQQWGLPGFRGRQQIINARAETVTEKPMFRRARLGVGYLPQEASIFRKLSVQDNIMAILETQNYKRSERKERLEQLLEEFKITHIRKTKAMSCSGGERRRLEIARALAANPDFLLLDEPFAGIDPIAVGDIQAIISSLREKGMGILITDHNVRETLSITDRAYIMYKSQVLTEGSSDFLANNEEAKRIYLGESFRLD